MSLVRFGANVLRRLVTCRRIILNLDLYAVPTESTLRRRDRSICFQFSLSLFLTGTGLDVSLLSQHLLIKQQWHIDTPVRRRCIGPLH